MRRPPSRWRSTWTIRSTALDDLGADGRGGQAHVAHLHHVLDAGQRVAGGVGVDRGHAAVVAGVHRLQHVECLGAADLADDDAVGAHAQRVAHQVALGDLALAFQAGRAGFQSHDMGLLQLQFGSILHRHDAFAGVDQARHGVHQGGLAGAGAAGDHHVQPARAAICSTCATGAVRAPKPIRLREVDRFRAEFADRDAGPVQRQRREHDVDAAAVLEAGVHHRADSSTRRPTAAAMRWQIAVRWRVVAETHVRQGHFAAALDEDAVGTVHHDVGDRVVGEQGFQRTEAQHVGHQLRRQRVLLAGVELQASFGGDFRQQAFHLRAQAFGRQGGDGGGFQPGEALGTQLGDSLRRRGGGRIGGHGRAGGIRCGQLVGVAAAERGQRNGPAHGRGGRRRGMAGLMRRGAAAGAG